MMPCFKLENMRFRETFKDMQILLFSVLGVVAFLSDIYLLFYHVVCQRFLFMMNKHALIFLVIMNICFYLAL